MWVWWWYDGRRHRYFHSFSIRIANNRPKCLFIIKIFFRLFRFLFSILYLVHRRRQITETKYIHTRWGKSFICKLANAATKLVQRFVYYKRALNQTFLHVCERKIKLFACRCSVWVVRFGMNVLYVRNTGAPSDTKKIKLCYICTNIWAEMKCDSQNSRCCCFAAFQYQMNHPKNYLVRNLEFFFLFLRGWHHCVTLTISIFGAMRRTSKLGKKWNCETEIIS